MEPYDFDKSLARLKAFKQQAATTFAEINELSVSSVAQLNERFLLFSQQTTFEFNEAFLNINTAFETSILMMGEQAAALWLGLGEGFSQTWTGIDGGTVAFIEHTNTGFTELWLGLGTGFVSLWAMIGQNTNEFCIQMKTTFDTLCLDIDTGFNDLRSGVNENNSAFIDETNSNFANTWLNLNSGFNEFWSGINSGTASLHYSVNENTNALLNEMNENYASHWSRVNDGFKTLWNGAEAGNTALENVTEKGYTSLLGNVTGDFSKMWITIGNGNVSLWANSKNGATTMLKGLKSDFEAFWTAVPNGMKDMALEVCTILNKLLSSVVSPINSVIRRFNSIPLIPDIPELNLTITPPTFARGGFPTQGQMFIAREAGPELVGTIGGSTAVVNNDQIIESVSAGVYRAVRSALSSQKTNGSINLIIDGAKVAEVVADNLNGITKRTGRCPILV